MDGRGIAGGLALLAGRGEGQRPAHEAARDADDEVGVAHVGMPQVPAGVGRQRHGDVGEADAADLVAVVVHVGHERRVGLALAGWELGGPAKRLVWAVVEPDGPRGPGREDRARDRLEPFPQGV